MPLSDVKVRNTKSRDKQYKLFDGEGLYLLVTPNGKKGWRFKYRFNNNEKLISFGIYPEISLSDAREKRFVARKQVAAGIDPSDVRKAQQKSAVQDLDSFEVVAREWHCKLTTTWTEGHAHTNLRRLERDVFPWLGDRAIADIVGSAEKR